MNGFFVTATDTGAGKTLVASGIIRALRKTGRRVAGMKPIASGCEQTRDGLLSEDAALLVAASELAAPMDLVNPYRFLRPIAPHIAAAQAGVRLDLKRIEAAYRELGRVADCVVVEGVGGLGVPLNEQEDVADLVRLLGLPVILVVGMRLGCLNHALLTAEALARRELPFCGWVANHVDPAMDVPDENVQTLESRFGVPLLGRVPFLPVTDSDAVAHCLNLAAILNILNPVGDEQQT